MPDATQELKRRIESSSKKKAVVKQQTLQPDAYEEKFHSEFCFISLVLGVFGLVLPFFSTLAIIFGIGGLMQTHRERMKGKWMAIAGMVLGFLGLVLLLVAIIFGIGFLENYLLPVSPSGSLLGNSV